MTVKLIAAVLILSIAGGCMFFGIEKYLDVVNELADLSGEVIIAADISESIDAFYKLESYFEEQEGFFSLFIHDSEVEKLREQMLEVITLLFNGDRDAAIVSVTRFRQQIIALGEAITPSLSNIV